MNVSVLGCGFVGLVTGACLAEVGHRVHCIDRDTTRVAAIASAKAPFFEADLDALLARELATGRLSIGCDIAQVAEADLVFICVGTPTVDGTIDLSQVLAAARALALHLNTKDDRFPVVVVKSTVLPGTTEGSVRHALEEASGLAANVDFGLAMNPEFLREGSAVADFRDPDRILLGSRSPRAVERLQTLYRPFASAPVVEMTPSNAEMAKYANNALLATLVSFVNDLATLSEGMEGTDIEVVADALALDRRLTPLVDGTRIKPGILAYLRAGIGFGGSCLPKDVTALSGLAATLGRPSPMLDAVLAANRSRPQVMVRTMCDTLGSLSRARLALLGLAFKPGTDDTRESVAFPIAEALNAAGAEVVAWDPMVTALDPKDARHLRLVADPQTALRGADAAVIVTAWPEFAQLDWETLVHRMRRPILFDGRNQLRGHVLPTSLIYRPIGVGRA